MTVIVGNDFDKVPNSNPDHLPTQGIELNSKPKQLQSKLEGINDSGKFNDGSNTINDDECSRMTPDGTMRQSCMVKAGAAYLVEVAESDENQSESSLNNVNDHTEDEQISLVASFADHQLAETGRDASGSSGLVHDETEMQAISSLNRPAGVQLREFVEQVDDRQTPAMAVADSGTATKASVVSISLAVSPTAVLEDGSTNLVYTFSRSGDTAKALTVNYSVAGTAAQGWDYTGIGFSPTTAVTFAAGSSIAVVTVEPRWDYDIENDETVSITLLPGSGYTIVTTEAVVGTISNDDRNMVEVGLPSGTTISEDGSQNLQVVFSRQGDRRNPLTVDFSVAGTAEFGLDYEQRGASSFNTSSGSVTFAAGAAVAAVSLDPRSDAISDGHETVVLSLRERPDYAIGANRSVSGTILDNDGPAGSVTSSPIRVGAPGRTSGEFHNVAAFAALRADGSVVTWGNSSFGGDSRGVAAQLSSGVIQIFSNNHAFAALKADGSVVTWGDSRFGGSSAAVRDQLSTGVMEIFSTEGAFAALKSDGSVVTWGHGDYGGDSSGVISQIRSDVIRIASTPQTFAALKSDGSVVTWGEGFGGGDSSYVASSLKSGVTQIFAIDDGYAALKGDGSVVSWGYYVNTTPLTGGIPRHPIINRTFVQIYSNTRGFAAITASGSVTTWGTPSAYPSYTYGDQVRSKLQDGVAHIAATEFAFAALRSDGSVVTWGDHSYGGDSSGVASQLASGVTNIVSNGFSFAALRSDGSVVTWGDLGYGGDSSRVASQLRSGVNQIVSNRFAFAALKSDGSVVSWGLNTSGGDSLLVASQLRSDVVQIFTTEQAFAALKADGSVVSWGRSWFGADSSAVAGQLTNVVAFANPFTDDRLEILNFSEQGILSFSQSAFTVDENGTAVTDVLVIRSGGSTGEVSATVNLLDGSATAPADYNNTPITVRFAAGETRKVVSIPVVNDSKVEANESIQLSLSTPTGGAILWGKTAATATIVDDDLELNFSSRSYRASENGLPAAHISINRSGLLSVPVAVTLVARNGSATAPHDYLDTPIVVAFAPGEASRTVTLPVVDDDAFEAEETILLSLVDPSNGATIGSQGSATLTITSDDWPDLVVSNIAAPIKSQSGQAIDITWTIRNQGNADATGSWIDHVYLSDDAALGQDLVLGSFRFTGSIAAGNSIERTQSVFLPLTSSGERRLVIQTNGNNDLIERPGSASNNSTIDDGSITITSSLANLRVSSVIPPDISFSSQEAVVEWIVTNTGNGPANASIWYDQIWLSADGTLDASDIYLGQAKNVSFLKPSESYRNQLAVALPQGIQGDYHFLVRTDFQFNGRPGFIDNRSYPGPVIESDETDNVGASSLTRVDLTPASDLQVTAISMPSNAFSGQAMLFTWVVANKGRGRTLRSNKIVDTGLAGSDLFVESQLSSYDPTPRWHDKVYMSSDAILDAGDRYLGQYLRTGNLNPDESYPVNFSVDLPIGVSGDFYFLIQTDANNQIFEGIDEANNLGYDTPATVVKLTPPPDLELEWLEVPALASASRALRFAYRVKNYGATITPNRAWTDTFYLSTDDQLDPRTDLRLGSKSHFGALAPDAEYGHYLDFTLPNTVLGTYYLFGVTDSNSEVFELDNLNNIALAKGPLLITSQPADLIVNATAPPTAEAGKSLSVSWTVTNQGIGDTAVSNWTDRVLLSADTSIGNADDISLANISRNGLLSRSETYSQTALVNLPFSLIGSYYLYVITDSSNQVYEASREGNNTSLQLINITRQTADLQVAEVSVQNSAISGTPFTVRWNVKNVGSNRSSLDYWYDRIYLSSDTKISSDDLHLGDFFRSGLLAVKGEYTASQTFSLPIDLEGNFYTLIHADIYNLIFEDTLDGNNVTATTNTTSIRLTPTPDLVIDSVKTAVTAVSGQSLNISWTVRNAGAGATRERRWHDTFYYSKDAYLDSTDLYLGFSDYHGTLVADGSYTKSQAFRLPQSAAGNAYIFAVADAGNQVYERGAENNNVGSIANAFLVSLSQPSDLVVGSMVLPANAVAGRSITIRYTVSNQGENPVQGSWSDSLYFSKDDQWDIDDVFFSEIAISESVASGGGYSRLVTAPLSGLAVGDYHLILRSDIRNQILESDEDNNLKATFDLVGVDVERLNLGTVSMGSLGQGQGAYYRFDASAGQTIRLSMDSVNNDTVNSLFVSRGEMPTRTRFEFTDPRPFIADPSIVMPITQDGTYYVFAYGNTASGATRYTLTAEEVPFSVFGIGIKTVGNTGRVTIEIDGALLANDTTFWCIDNQGNRTIATRILIESSTRAYATFDLTGKAAGLYALEALKTDGRKVRLNGAFTVQDNFDASLSTNIDGPLQVRPQRDNSFTLSYGNNGGADIQTPLLLVESASPSPFGLSQKSMVSEAPLQILSRSQDGPVDILRPGEAEVVAIYFRSSQANDLAFRVRAVEADDTTVISNLDWASIEKAIRPRGLSDSEWQDFWGEIQPRIGPTWGDYVNVLNRIANRISEPGEGERDARDLFTELYAVDPDYRPSSFMAGQLLDAKTGAALVGVEVGAYRFSDGVVELAGTTVTDVSGNFSIQYLQAGHYDLFLSDRGFDMDRDGETDTISPNYIVSDRHDLTDLKVYGDYTDQNPSIQIFESETSLSTDSQGRSHILWRRDNQIWHAYSDGSEWIDATAIDAAIGSRVRLQTVPHLTNGEEDSLIASWQQGSGNNSEIFYAIASRVDGRYSWSQPIALTNDNVEDRGSTLIVLDDGRVLLTSLKSDFDLDDDTDLYYELIILPDLGLSTHSLSLSTERFSGRTPGVFQDEHASDALKILSSNSWGGSFGLDLGRFKVPEWIPIFGGEYSFKVSGELGGTKDCNGAFGEGKLLLDLKTPAIARIKGEASESEEWSINKENCTYELNKRTVAGEVTFGSSKEIPIKFYEMLREALKKRGITINSFPNLEVALDGGMAGQSSWERNGKVSENWQIIAGAQAAARISSVFHTSSNSVETLSDYELSLSGKLKGSLQDKKVNIDTEVTLALQGEFFDLFKTGISYTWRWENVLPIGFEVQAATLDDEAVGVLTEENRTIYGTNYVYGTNHILSSIADDYYNDSPASLVKLPSGLVIAAWIKTRMVGNEAANVLVSATYNGDEWQAPIEVTSSNGLNRDVHLAVLSDGRPIMIWSMIKTSSIAELLNNGTTASVMNNADIVYSILDNGHWSDPVNVFNYAGADVHPVSSQLPNGKLAVAWLNGSYSDQQIMVSFWDGSSWSTPDIINSASAIDDLSLTLVDNTLTAFWSQEATETLEATSRRIFTSSYTDNWSLPELFMPIVAPASTANGALDIVSESVGNDIALNTLSLPSPGSPPEDCCKCKGVKDRRVIKSLTGCGGRSGSETTFDQETCIETTILYIPETCPPKDPNDIIGPLGTGQENWIANAALPYTIRFENDPVFASAAAQEVIITQQLDGDLDWRTFRLDDFGWGGLIFDLPGTTAFHSQRFDFVQEHGYLVDVTAGIDIASGVATWHIITIDPNTGDKPLGVDQGFLPVNNDDGVGEGFVSYQIRTKRTIQTGTVIDAQARIIFDTEEPIDTPPIFNTIDINAPISTIFPLEALINTPDFLVQWQGNDDANGSAISAYNVYVSENGEEFSPWLVDTSLTEAIYPGMRGNTYALYVSSVDRAGNIENAPAAPQATTRITGGTGSIGDFVWLDTNANGSQDVSESGLANINIHLYDNANIRVASASTDASGGYRFNNLDTGDYYLEVVAPTGYVFTSPHQGNDSRDSDVDPTNGRTNLITVTSGNHLNWDAGLYQPASISGQVWNDIDGNGLANSEPMIPGWTVYIDDNNNNQLDSVETATQTNVDGQYTFNNLKPGSFNVSQVVPAGWKQTYPFLTITTTAADNRLSLPALNFGSVANHQASLNFDSIHYVVTEAGQAITEITITRTGALDGIISATLSFVDKTAKGCLCAANSVTNDFNNSPILITFLDKEISKTVTVQNAMANSADAIRIRDDSKAEPSEDFQLQLSNPSSGAVIGDQGTATVTIIDNDSASGADLLAALASTQPVQPASAFSLNPAASALIDFDGFLADSRFASFRGQGFSSVIIDTGIDADHSLFGTDLNRDGHADRLAYQYDFADGDADANDRSGHGTHIASIISSVASGSDLISLKVFKDSGSGSFADLERALQWVNANATAYNIASVNLSLGDGLNWADASSRYGLGDEFAALASQGVLISAAAGNSFYTFASTPGLSYPGVDPNVIPVGAVWTADVGGTRRFTNGAIDFSTAPDRIASFSQREPDGLPFLAPGILIEGARAGGSTISMGGTSQATAFISGLATIAQQISMAAIGRRLSLVEFKTLLAQSSDWLVDGDDENDNVINTGASFPRVNALRLAETIAALDPQSVITSGGSQGGSVDGPAAPSTTTLSLSHTINLVSGQVASGVDFGNQLLPILSITPLAANQLEGNSGTTAYNFLVTRSDNGNGSSTATWTVSGSSGNPADATDFVGGSLPSGTVSLAAGETSQTITIQVAADRAVELDEGFSISLSNPSGALLDPDASSASGSIRNDDWPTIELSVAPARIREDDMAALIYSFRRDGDLSTELTVSYTISGTADLLTDYEGIAPTADPRTIRFAAGEASTQVALSPIRDGEFESEETVVFTLTDGSGYNIATAMPVVGTIVNSDGYRAGDNTIDGVNLGNAGAGYGVRNRDDAPLPVRYPYGDASDSNPGRGWRAAAAVRTATGYALYWRTNSVGPVARWDLDSSGVYTSGLLLSAAQLIEEEALLHLDLNLDGYTSVVTSFDGVNLGLTSLGYALLQGNGTPLQVSYPGGNASASNPGDGWLAVAATTSDSGYALYWSHAASGQAARWELDRYGAYTSGAFLSASQLIREEARLNLDLNGDGYTSGSTTLAGVNLGVTSQGYALRAGDAAPLEVVYPGGPASASNPGHGWSAVAATSNASALGSDPASGYQLFWRNALTGEAARWQLDASGAYSSGVYLSAYELIDETSTLNLDLNSYTSGPSSIAGVNLGSTILGYALRVGDNAPLQVIYPGGQASDHNPGHGWSAAAAAASADGYALYWRNLKSGEAARWHLDGSGSYQTGAFLSASELIAEEVGLQSDLNGDAIIGPTFTSIETHGNATLLRQSDGMAAVRSNGSVDSVISPFGLGVGDASREWQMLAAETVEGEDQILWRNNLGNVLHVWTLNSSWHWTSSQSWVDPLSLAARGLETSFQLDLNGDRLIGSMA
jgi:subtilase family serine protease/alpha-tubulin suppressor-like RCC1 family protein